MANGGAFNSAINSGVNMGAFQPLLNVGAQMANGTYQPQAAASMASASLPGTAPNAPPPGVAPTGTAPMYQPVTGPNVGQTSANTYNTAVGATAQGMGFTPNQVTPNTVAGTNMQQYQNPFQQQVIDTSLADMNRANQMALNNVGAQAQGAGAFGGSRQGVAEAETNRNFANQAAQMTAGLNQAGYQNAQNMAQFDIGNNFAAQNQNNANNFAATQNMMGGANQLANLSQQGFDYSNRINENMLNTGNAQQNLIQQIINSANGQYGDIAQYPQNMLNLPVAALGGAQFPTTTTNAKQPGLFDYLTMATTSMGGR
jgi:hypothetical protein